MKSPPLALRGVKCKNKLSDKEFSWDQIPQRLTMLSVKQIIQLGIRTFLPKLGGIKAKTVFVSGDLTTLILK